MAASLDFYVTPSLEVEGDPPPPPKKSVGVTKKLMQGLLTQSTRISKHLKKIVLGVEILLEDT